MATLKGQNFRVLDYDSTAQKYKVIAMATNCVITYTNNTEQAQTKDDVGMAARPSVVSKSWHLRVDSLSAADVGVLLTAMKTSKQFYLLWDEVSTTDNQTPEGNYALSGKAYLTDATFQFDNRTNSQKNLTFTGIGAVEVPPASIDSAVITSGSYTKGQYVRLYLNNADVLAAARSLQLHVSLSLEDCTTKDTPGDWVIQEPTELSYDIQTSALVRANEVITSQVSGIDWFSIENDATSNDPSVNWQIANVSGANNRTKGSVIVSGNGLITSLELDAAVKVAASYKMTLTGVGDYTVGA